jgi:hypothetical protein
MSYLYGDSTPSTLDINYIEFLRDAVEFCVQVLLGEQRIIQARSKAASLDKTTGTEIARLEQLGAAVAKTIEGLSWGDGDSATTRCAAAILRSSADLVRSEIASVQSALAAEVQQQDAQSMRERDATVKALQALLARHDLPYMTFDVHLGVVGGTRYACRALMATPFGLGAVIDLEIPSTSLFSQVVRVERLVERLEVQAPEMSGWVRKELKLRPQHLEKLHITEVSLLAGSGAFKLRTGPDGSGPGFDVMVDAEGPRPVRMARVEERDEAGPPFEADEGDVKKLLALYQKLAAALNELTRRGRTVAEATIDGESMRTFANPSLLVERIVGTMAPVVREIAARSHSPGEIVLRRLIGDDRREEIFLSKDELRRKLEPLADGRRALFDPLWGETTAAAPTPLHAPVSAPPPAPPPRAERAATPPPRTDRSTPRAGSMMVSMAGVASGVGSTGSPTVPALAPATASIGGEPTAVMSLAAAVALAAESPRAEPLRARVGTPIMGSSPSASSASGPVVTASPAPASVPAPSTSPAAPSATAEPAGSTDSPRRVLGSLLGRTQTPGFGASSSPAAADSSRPQPLLRRAASPAIGTPSQPPSGAAAASSPAAHSPELVRAETPRRPFSVPSLRSALQVPAQPAVSDPGPTPPAPLDAKSGEIMSKEPTTPAPEPIEPEDPTT